MKNENNISCANNEWISNEIKVVVWAFDICCGFSFSSVCPLSLQDKIVPFSYRLNTSRERTKVALKVHWNISSEKTSNTLYSVSISPSFLFVDAKRIQKFFERSSHKFLFAVACTGGSKVWIKVIRLESNSVWHTVKTRNKSINFCPQRCRCF